jgi:hypothetical protein
VTEESKYLDKLFQSKFAGFEAAPPASVWENVHAELHGKGGSSINPVNLAVLAALVMISGLLGFSIIKDSSRTLRSNIIVDGHTAMIFEEPAMASPGALEIPANIENIITDNPVQEPTSKVLSPVIKPERDIDRLPEQNEPHATLHDYYVKTTFGEAFSEESRLAKLRSRRSYSIYSSFFSIDDDYIQVRDSKYNPMYTRMNNGEHRYNRRASWQMGILFSPEVIFYPDDSIPNQRSYTLEISGKWKKNEFFIESGLGVSFSSDDGKYAIDYEKFLGTYDDVYNVTFDTTVGGAIVPIYHTNIVDVYDSISKFRIEKTKNHYTYLQIPVYLGFQKQMNRFGWFIKGGPIFNVLIHENIPTPDGGNDKIIAIDQEMPSRVNTNWQLAISAGLNYQLSDKVSIAIEPIFKYYLNSQYQRKYITTRHPYSVGLRTGLLFNF